MGIAHQGDQSLTDYQGIAVLYFIVQCVTKTLANFSVFFGLGHQNEKFASVFVTH
jgi:hypothetical protein